MVMDYLLFTASTLPWTLPPGAAAYIGQTGTLGTYEDAISASGETTIGIDGALNSLGGRGIVHQGDSFHLAIGPGASVGSVKYDAVQTSSMGGIQVLNNGYLHGNDALRLFSADENSTIDVVNSGQIDAASDGLVVESGAGTATIINSGDISAISYAVHQLGGITKLFNHGTMAGRDQAFLSQGGHTMLKNHGIMAGHVTTADEYDLIVNNGVMESLNSGAGADVIFNRGELDYVVLGDGNDIYRGERGSVEFYVSGGEGEDTAIGGGGDDFFEGDEGADVLHGRQGDDTLRGGKGNDTISGGRGDDKMIGGSGADVFRFAFDGGDDTVRDFSGRDVIDLSRLNLTGYARDIRGHVQDTKQGSSIDLTEEYDLRINLTGVDAADLSASDFLF